MARRRLSLNPSQPPRLPPIDLTPPLDEEEEEEDGQSPLELLATWPAGPWWPYTSADACLFCRLAPGQRPPRRFGDAPRPGPGWAPAAHTTLPPNVIDLIALLADRPEAPPAPDDEELDL